MTSTWPAVLASLDQDLTVLCESLEKLEAAASVDIGKVIQQLKTAAGASADLRSLVLAEFPDASWEDRKELQGLLDEITKRIEARAVEQRRSRLLDLAAEIGRGEIVHRRAARVSQLNEFREEAVSELRTLGASAAPPTLPGPEADQWVTWACNLKEPDDAASLQALRDGFPWLDEFVANLEPGMWVTEATQAASSKTEEVQATPAASDIQERRERLLAVAAALEGGSVIHHRAIRVTQVNQLRDGAVADLRSHAQSRGTPPTLPGPQAEQWTDWACSLKEPEDAEALQSIRKNFVQLDEFVANLEPGMWVKAGAPKLDVVARAETPANGPDQKPKSKKVSGAVPVEPAFVPPPTPPPAKVSVVKAVPEAKTTVSPVLAKVKELWQTSSRMFLICIAALVIVMLGAMLWVSHRRHASAVSAVQAAVPDATHMNPTTPLDTALATTPANAAVPGSLNPPPAKDTKPKEQDQAPQEKPVRLLNDAALRTPTAIPGRAALRKADDTAAEAPALLPGTLSGGGVPSVIKEVSVAQPKAAEQKIRVSTGVAQGQLIRQVPPQYPTFARTAGIKGTVVLQAVIGKDGTVKNVQALHGPPALIQPAVDAVKQWRYKPFSLNGEPAEADIQINVNFTP